MGSLVRSGLLSKVAHQCGDEASWVFLSIGDAVHAINQLQHAKDFRSHSTKELKMPRSSSAQDLTVLDHFDNI